MSTVASVEIPGFRGSVLSPESESYEQVRPVWNAAVDRRPAVIARCTGAADVIASIRYAREQDLQIAVRGGGHSQAGFSTCDGGLVVDLSSMRGIRIDPITETAAVQPGVTWAELDADSQAFGLATPGGEVSDTGVAGLTLGGGIGWLARMYGLSCDNLLGADVVTADGKLMHADDQTHPDLFWALRGGGGNFGVVTEFRFRLHPVDEVLAGPIMYPAEQAPEVMRAVHDLALSLPNELALNVVLATMPSTPDTAAPLRGARTLLVVPAWFGPSTRGSLVMDELRTIGKPVVDAVGPTSYTALQSTMDPMTPPGLCYFMRSDMLGPLDGTAIDALVERWATVPSPRSAILLRLGGGAMGDVASDACAFTHRDAAWIMSIISVWDSPTDDPTPHRRWAREIWSTLHRHARGVYVNYLDGDEGPDRVVEAYGGEATFQRLRAVKATYDPANIFRLNQNIPPAGSAL